MAQEVEFRLNTSEKDARWMRGRALSETVRIDQDKFRQAITKAMMPGLASLQRQVAAVRTVTGRLRKSPGIVTRKYGGANRLIIVGLVGYKAGVAPHSRYLELGTPPRAGRGIVKARRYAWRAFWENQDTMKASAEAALTGLIEDAIDSVS